MQPLGPGDPRRIADFELMNRIGTGGMGVVYLGRRTGDGALAAVKVIHEHLLHDPEVAVRFDREAAAAQQVRSPRVAAVLDAGRDGPRAYLAAEYVQGPTLLSVVSEYGPLDERALADLAAGLAETLSVLHGHGLIHRYLTPRNVLLTHTGPRVIDFGIAYTRGAAPLTATGAVIGTPGFIAPERLLHGQSVPAGDVFSVGALLLYASTGRAPFGDGEPMEVNFRAATTRPDLSAVPAALAPLIAECLALDPTSRPDAVRLAALARAVEPTLRGSAVVPPTIPATLTGNTFPQRNAALDYVPPPPPSRRVGRWQAIAAAVIVASTAIIVLVLTHPSPTPSPQTSGTGVPVGTYNVNSVIYQSASLVVTLTTMRVESGGHITVTVVYHNVATSLLPLSCASVSRADIDLLTGADGTTFRAAHSYCSDRPTLAFDLAAGGSMTSYADFTGVTGLTAPVEVTWQTGSSITGVVAGIPLRTP